MLAERIKKENIISKASGNQVTLIAALKKLLKRSVYEATYTYRFSEAVYSQFGDSDRTMYLNYQSKSLWTESPSIKVRWLGNLHLTLNSNPVLYQYREPGMNVYNPEKEPFEITIGDRCFKGKISDLSDEEREIFEQVLVRFYKYIAMKIMEDSIAQGVL